MSLASTAAPFNDDNQFYSEANKEDTPINRKRLASSSAHNKTQKRMLPIDFNSEKVNNVLQSIHNNSNDNELGDFNPKRNQASALSASSALSSSSSSALSSSLSQVPLNPLNKLLAPPESMREKEGFNNNIDASTNSIPVPLDNEEMELQELQSAFLNDAQVRDYYRKLVPNFQNKAPTSTPMDNSGSGSTNKMYYKEKSMDQGNGQGSNWSGGNGQNDALLNKINYMINLLEDQQDERTNNVTEEVVLYSFLGIFIIFVVDSFARVGKYTR
jgi:hypothetical protein